MLGVLRLSPGKGRTRLGKMLNESCLCHRAVGQHKVIVMTDTQCCDSTVAVAFLKPVHHDEWLTLGNQLLYFLTLYHFSVINYQLSTIN
jgi:hypothetical protein